MVVRVHLCTQTRQAIGAAPHSVNGDTMKWESRAGEYCKGSTDHRLQASSQRACERACLREACICYHYKFDTSDSNCRVLRRHEFKETRKSKVGFTAYLRSDLLDRTDSGRAKERPIPQNCGPGSGAALKAGADMSTVPRFYIYSDVKAFDHRPLMDCYSSSHGGAWPWSDDAPHASHLSNAIWIVQALLSHRARVPNPSDASILLVPTFASLSEAVGSCGGSSHYQRMAAASNALKTLPSFRARPQDHLLIDAADTPRSLLGELGALASSKGAWAACLQEKLCPRFKPDKVRGPVADDECLLGVLVDEVAMRSR